MNGEDRAYVKWRKIQLEERPWCEARARIRTVDRAHRCSGHGRSAEVHHRRFRSAGGALIGANAMLVCRVCHDWIHRHPTAGHDLGLIVRQGDDEWWELGKMSEKLNEGAL